MVNAGTTGEDEQTPEQIRRLQGYREEDPRGQTWDRVESRCWQSMLWEEPTVGVPSWLSTHPHPFTWHESPR